MPHASHSTLTACAVLAALTLWVSAAAAQSLALSNLVVDDQIGNVTARFGVAVDDLAEITDLLHGGATLALKCRAELTRPGGFWSGTRVARAELVSRLKYDSLRRKYVLRVPGRPAPIVNSRLSEVLDSGWGSLALGLGSWRRLERGREYDLTLSIRLRRMDIPNWIQHTLFFWNWDVVPESSYRLTFQY